jgi:Gpi18-like mannosyltransferase
LISLKVSFNKQNQWLKASKVQYMVSISFCSCDIYKIYKSQIIYIKIIDKYINICIINCNLIKSSMIKENWRSLG